MITRRLLLADSDTHMHAFVRRAVEGFRLLGPDQQDVRFTVDCASCDEEAIRQLSVDPPHILVAELWAPCLDGLKILQSLKTRLRATEKVPCGQQDTTPEIAELPPKNSDSDMAVVVAATRPSIPAAVEATKLGAFDFLAKPLSEQQLRDMLRKATAHQMGWTGVVSWGSDDDAQTSAQILSRISAAFAQLASTAVSLHW